MIFARKEIVVPYGAVGQYGDGATFRLPEQATAAKLTVRVRDATAIVQVSESWPVVFDSPENTEQLIEPGFQSLVYLAPVTGFRFRCDEPTKTARISFTAYG